MGAPLSVLSLKPMEFLYGHSAAPHSSNEQISVLIPSWNNLPYLRCCVESLRKNSGVPLQLIVIVNEGKDGSLDWVKAQGNIDWVYAPVNVGICFGLNAARPLVHAPWMVYANDDMYFTPGWDLALLQRAEQVAPVPCLLSATMIEPSDTGNPCVVVADFGSNVENFREAELLEASKELQRSDWSGSSWPPVMVHRDLWDLVGGLSVEFSPGMYSDPDFSRKLYAAGVREFIGLGSALVYHFGSKSTGRIKRNDGRNTFLRKWGHTAGAFNRELLRLGQAYTGPVGEKDPGKESVWKRLLAELKRD